MRWKSGVSTGPTHQYPKVEPLSAWLAWLIETSKRNK